MRIILSILLLSVCYPCDEGYTEIDGECYYQSDLDVLQDFIDLNESLSGFEPLEIGSPQEWTEGRLIELSLSSNQLTTLPESIGNLSSLEYLYLYYNQLTSLPESIGNLSSLKIINISYNQLTTLPESIGDLSSLKGLYLYDNQLTSIPESIGNLDSLERLYLYDNQLTILPESIGDLSSLERLYLSSNQFTSLPESIGDLSSLESLKLYSNQLTTLPESIGDLSSLERLYLYDNQLTYLPESICNLPSDCDIDVSNNQLCEEYHYDCIDDWGEQECELSITDNLIPIVYKLSTPYPNPFNPTTTISFSIPQFGLTTITAYDITGRQLETLTNEVLSMGSYNINWNASSHPSGVYLIRMESGDFTQTQKVVLVK